jgi:hypothetical protein
MADPNFNETVTYICKHSTMECNAAGHFACISFCYYRMRGCLRKCSYLKCSGIMEQYAHQRT